MGISRRFNDGRSLPPGKMRIEGDQPVMEGECLRLCWEIIESVNAAGPKVPVDGPEMCVLRLARFDNLRVQAAVADHNAGLDFEGIKIVYVLHAARCSCLRGVNR